LPTFCIKKFSYLLAKQATLLRRLTVPNICDYSLTVKKLTCQEQPSLFWPPSMTKKKVLKTLLPKEDVTKPFFFVTVDKLERFFSQYFSA
jgi:hypothetical protein